MVVPGKNIASLIGVVILVAALSGCGGGGGGSTETSGTSKTLSWDPPNTYTDNTSLDPIADLDSFEVYVKQDGNFSSADNADASLQAVVPETGQVRTSFDLSNLSPFFSQGVTYNVAVRAVAKNGLKSDFSESVTFSF